MSEQHIETFFEHVSSAIPGLRRAKGRKYGSLRLKPRSELACVIKKDTIEVSFITNGKEGDLPPKEFSAWVTDSGVLNGDGSNQKYMVRNGRRNKDKVEVYTYFDISSEEEITRPDLLDEVTGACRYLLAKASSIATPSRNEPSGTTNEEQVTNQMSDFQKEGYLTKLDIMLVSSIGRQLAEVDEDVNVDTLGGRKLEIYCLTIPDHYSEQFEFQGETHTTKHHGMTFVYRLVQQAPFVDGGELSTIKDFVIFDEGFQDDAPTSDWVKDPDDQGFINRLYSVFQHLKEDGAKEGTVLESEEFFDDFEQLGEVLEDILRDGYAQKLYRFAPRHWKAGEAGFIPFDQLGLEDPHDLIGTIVIAYTPTFDIETYKLDYGAHYGPFVPTSGSDCPEWHDEVDTVLVYINESAMI